MWKLQDFTVIQILREINHEESGSIKTALFAILAAMNFRFLDIFLTFSSVKFTTNQNPKPR